MNTPSKKLSSLELAQLLQDAEKNWPTMLELYAQIAKETKAKFDALVDSGFTPVQALELIKAKAI